MNKENIQIATDLVEECLKDSKVTSAVRMCLAGLIAEKLHEQYKAGMMRAAQIVEFIWDNGSSGAHGGEQTNRTASAIRAEAEKAERHATDGKVQ